MSAAVCPNSVPVLLFTAEILAVLLPLGLMVAAITGLLAYWFRPRESEATRIFREQHAAIADITAIRREAERQMREIAREDPGDVIDSTAVELPPKRTLVE